MSDQVGDGNTAREAEVVGDPLLVAIVALINDHPDNSASITLTVAGATISGTLISNRRWMDLVAQRTATAGGTQPGEGVSALFTNWRAHLDKMAEEEAQGDELDLTAIGYVHLRDARFLSGASPVPTGDSGVLWRGSVAAVSGWSFGSFA